MLDLHRFEFTLRKDWILLLREMPKLDSATLELDSTTLKMAKLTLESRAARYKKIKVPCKLCGSMVRRDGMGAHRDNTKCKRRVSGKTYNHKKHNSTKVRCTFCEKMVTRSSLRGHQRRKICLKARKSRASE